jgi:predicted GNAT family acetyltransferase
MKFSKEGCFMADVHDNRAASRYELDVEGAVAFVDYVRTPDAIRLVHTEVPTALEGRGIGSRLVKGVLEDVRRQGLEVIVRCPFIEAYLKKHPELQG